MVLLTGPALKQHTALCLSPRTGVQAMAKLHAVGYREDDVHLHCAPLFHIGGLSSMIAMLAVGATQVRPRFVTQSCIDLYNCLVD